MQLFGFKTTTTTTTMHNKILQYPFRTMNLFYCGFRLWSNRLSIVWLKLQVGKVTEIICVYVFVSLIDYQNLQFNYLADNWLKRNDEICRKNITHWFYIVRKHELTYKQFNEHFFRLTHLLFVRLIYVELKTSTQHLYWNQWAASQYCNSNVIWCYYRVCILNWSG